VIGELREVEEGTAISVWAASLGGGEALPFHAEVEPLADGGGVLSGLPELTGAAGALLLADPFTFPTDPVLRELSSVAPMLPLLGGLASARSPDAETPLMIGEQVHTSGAVGVRFDGVEILPCVSQGAAPIGPELTITACEGPIIAELAGRPALEKLRETIEALTSDDLRLVQGGLLMGIVVDNNKPEYVQGDFLVRGLVGADPDTGQVAVGTDVRPGQVVRLHARDAASADRDLRQSLSARMLALGGRAPAGALLISCNGRGADLFGHAHHDAAAVDDELGGAPAAGFFAAGEIGPVGGEYFLHGFTATIAVFAQ
jgi:small ligand-binding sensory domain FIST